MKRKSNKNILVIILVVIVAFSLLGFSGLASIFGSGSGNSLKTTREIALGCTLDMYTKFHIHPHLDIIISGAKQTLPASIGVKLSCMNPLHTHDETGTIHVESPEKKDFTLGDFFAVWNKPFSGEQILDYKRDADHEIVMMVDGRPNTEFENLVLEDNQQITLEYRTIQR